ncbi:MAG TPA: hypothetical protein VGW40_03780 [Allosphingosinicella sp.]|nr:hypothetical protein [Allosphingosinicella sp.]
MAPLLRILNAFAAALLLVMALVSLAFLAAGRDGFGGGPGGRWSAAAWAPLFALLAVAAFLNLRRRLPALNLVAALPLLAGAAALEGTARLLCIAAALPFALTLLLLAATRRSD